MGVTVIYTNENGDSIEFSKESEIRITDIDGLSSNDIDLSEATVNNQIGSSITGISVEAKDITINGRYKYDPKKRKKMLAVILPGVTATLRYVNDNEDIDVYWKVTPKKTPVISNGVVWQSFQIQLRLPYPYARKYDSNITEFNTLQSMHRFPRSYSSTVPFKLSSREYQPLRQIINKGSIDTGFVLTMKANVDGVKSPRITRIDTQEHISFPNLVLNLNDVIQISTYENERYCRLIRNGVTSNIFSQTDYASTFFQLKPGANDIRYSAEENEKSLEVKLTFDDTVVGV